MKKLLTYILGIITALSVTYAGFTVIDSLCVGGSCITNRGVFSNKLQYRITVGSGQTYTTLKSAVDWINASGGDNKREILLDGGHNDLTETITIDHVKPIAIRGLGFEVTSLVATGAMSGPMFIINSPVEITNLMMNGQGLASDGVQVTATGGDFIQLQNIGIQQFTNGISQLADSDMRVFNSVIFDNTDYGTFISGGSYRSANTDYDNQQENVALYAGSGQFFSSEHDKYTIYSGQVGIAYYPTTYTNYSNIAIFNNNFVTEANATILSGFDFTLARDADIEIYGNIGIEDYRPHGKYCVSSGGTSATYTTQVWAPAQYTLTKSYSKKRDMTSTGRLTFLSSHEKSVQMWIDGSITTSTSQSNIEVAIVKNGMTGTQYGNMDVFLDQNARAFNWSTNVYLDDVNQGDYFEIYVYVVGSNDTLIFQNINWMVDSR